MEARRGLRFPTSEAAYQFDPSDSFLGRGGAAVVHRAYCLPLDVEVAIKIIDLEECESSLEELAQEAALLHQVNHPHLLPLLCSFVVARGPQFCLWLVMPLVHGGSLGDLLRARCPSGLPEPAIASVMRDLLSALDYLHRQCRVTHRDVKSANVLLDQVSGAALLADLGAAARGGAGGAGNETPAALITGFAGSPCYMAPEVAMGEPYDWHADIWSAGITLVELVRGRPPLYSLPQRQLWVQLAHGAPPSLGSAAGAGGRQLSRDLVDLAARCLVKDPLQRPSAAQLLQHRFFYQHPTCKGRQAVAALLLPAGSSAGGLRNLRRTASSAASDASSDVVCTLRHLTLASAKSRSSTDSSSTCGDGSGHSASRSSDSTETPLSPSSPSGHAGRSSASTDSSSPSSGARASTRWVTVQSAEEPHSARSAARWFRFGYGRDNFASELSSRQSSASSLASAASVHRSNVTARAVIDRGKYLGAATDQFP